MSECYYDCLNDKRRTMVDTICDKMKRGCYDPTKDIQKLKDFDTFVFDIFGMTYSILESRYVK